MLETPQITCILHSSKAYYAANTRNQERKREPVVHCRTAQARKGRGFSRAKMIQPVPLFSDLAPPVARAVGLFRSVKPGARGQRLDVVCATADLEFRFVGPSLLGVDDMRVLQSIVALAGQQNHTPRRRLGAVGEDRAEGNRLLLPGTFEVHTAYDELARTIGYVASGSSADVTIRNALERLFAVSVLSGPAGSENARPRDAGHLLEPLPDTNARSGVHVRLCPLLASSVLSGPGAAVRVDLAEARKLKTDIARLLHTQLSWVGPGEVGIVGLDALIQYVYGIAAVTDATWRQRKVRAKAGLNELVQTLGWRVSPARDGYAISRPAAPPGPSHRKPLEQILAAIPAVQGREGARPYTPQSPAEQAAYDLGARGAEVMESERLLFEAWMAGHCWAVCGTWTGKTYVGENERDGWPDSQVMRTRQLWATWRDGRALARA